MPRVVSDVCGVQAQVLSGAALSLCARVKNITMHDVEDALWKQRILVKTWCMRGTLHILSSRDLPLNVAALKTNTGYKSNSWLKFYQQNLDEIERITIGIRAALNHSCLTREELVEKVAGQQRLSPGMRREMLSGWGSLLQPAAYQGNLCFGPSRGLHVTFVRPDQWLGKWDEPTNIDAMKILVRRFFTTYGPATYQDFGHWWGAPPPTARKLVALIADELEEVEFDDYRSMMRARDINEIQSIEESSSTRLLPSWDVYVMFYHPRQFFAPQEYRTRIFRQIKGNAPVLLVDGIAAGTWEKTRKKAGTEIMVRPFKKLDLAQKRAIEEEAGLLREFFGTNVQVSFTA